jgi:hypothetical protein
MYRDGKAFSRLNSLGRQNGILSRYWETGE